MLVSFSSRSASSNPALFDYSIALFSVQCAPMCLLQRETQNWTFWKIHLDNEQDGRVGGSLF
jgi:hypothetical protein